LIAPKPFVAAGEKVENGLARLWAAKTIRLDASSRVEVRGHETEYPTVRMALPWLVWSMPLRRPFVRVSSLTWARA